jgi:hypothetical protein
MAAMFHFTKSPALMLLGSPTNGLMNAWPPLSDEVISLSVPSGLRVIPKTRIRKLLGTPAIAVGLLQAALVSVPSAGRTLIGLASYRF